MTENDQDKPAEYKRRDWEKEIRNALTEALKSSDTVKKALAEEVLKIEILNEFCFVISPKILKHLLESEKQELQDITYRLWSSKEEGHVCVIAVNKKREKIFVIEVAGLLSRNEESDSPLGIHELNPKSTYKLFGNPSREQFISPEYTTPENFITQPQSEEQMGSVKLQNLNQLVEE